MPWPGARGPLQQLCVTRTKDIATYKSMRRELQAIVVYCVRLSANLLG